MRKIIIPLIVIFITLGFTTDLSKKELEEHTIDEIYLKKDLPYGTLDDEGNSIDEIFLKSSLKNGRYDVTISDGPGDLFKVDGTDYYIKFLGYYGYVGYYGDKGILDINGYNKHFYKKK